MTVAPPVEFWGGPKDGDVVNIPTPPDGVYPPIFAPSPVSQLAADEGDMVLCRYQVFSGLPDHRGLLTAEFVGWE